MSDSGSASGGDGEEEEIYCICRTSDSTRFMIACDECEEWYHGDCIGVTERDAKYIKRFYCDRCRRKNPDLKIRYKESHKNRKHGGEEKTKEKEKAHKAEKSEKHERVDKVEKREKAEKSEKEKERQEKQKKREEKEAKKAARAEKERLRAEKEQARAEKERERAEKEKEKERLRAEKEREEAKAAAQQQQQQRPRPPRGCGLCTGCLREDDCGQCSTCRGALHRPCKRRLCQGPPPAAQPPSQPSPLRVSNRPPPSPPPREPPREPTPPPPPGPARRKSTETPRRPPAVGRRKRRLDSDDEVEPPDGAVKQCYGPQCVRPTRPGSRYCSDQCGLNLARNRIFQVLPQRIQEWNMTRCVAEDRNMRTLERIRREQLDAQTQLERLTRAHQELDRVCERGRRGTVDPAALEEDAEEEPHSIHCVTCGHEVPTRNAIRHMEKCFGKYESQTSFGSLYQTRVEGFNMFCDFYNPAQRTYCKRLRVLCPEHCKNPKVADDEVCGCPLVADVFTNIGQFCRAPKKKCLKHFSWEKLRRAELDMERVRWAMKMDELLEQERQCRQSMANRAGVLALMLHSTYDHDVMEKVQSQQKKMQNKVKVKVS